MDRRDWILLSLSVANDGTLTPVQLQKSLFLIGAEKTELIQGEYYNFSPYAYGPFDRLIYRDADDLAQDGFLAIEPSRPRRYVITAQGLARARSLARFEALEPSLRETVEWVKSRSFSVLVSDIYRKYPAMRVNSIFR